MASPFPGMDPFIEGQKWEDFHTRLMTAIGDALVPCVRPRYTVDVERRVYLEALDPDEPVRSIVADVGVMDRGEGASGSVVAVGTETTVEPVACVLPMTEERREVFLVIRRGDTREIVTVIELLSPSNKRPGRQGRDQYIEKRRSILESRTHLVEIDLVRGGRRMPATGVPEGDYLAIISRSGRRPLADAYAWPLAHVLPAILIPLSGDDPDVTLELQQVFDLVYDRAGYDYSLNYTRTVEPSLDDSQVTWVASVLSET